jgi:tRNA (cmo5U34)-methyltransferase
MLQKSEEKTGNVGDNIKAENASWNFKGDVAKTFSSHVSRSVPLYLEGHKLVCALSDFFVKEDSICYELGTSVGELIIKLANHHNNKKKVQWIGIDSVEEMINMAIKNSEGIPNLSYCVDDINIYPFEKCDLIVCYYIIQFVHPKLRQELLTKLYNSLNWGGALILFEKVRGPDARFQDILTTLYSDYKLEQGFNTEEIVAKTRSLKGVLEPFSTQGNIDLLKRAGFVDITTVMKYLCFEGFLAIK